MKLPGAIGEPGNAAAFPVAGEALGRQSLPHDGGQRTVGPGDGASHGVKGTPLLLETKNMFNDVQSDLGS